MGKIRISWTRTTTERFETLVKESDLPSDWRERLDGGATEATEFLGDFEWEDDHSLGRDEKVESRKVLYQVFDEADFGALEAALNTPHVPTYVPSVAHPDLVTVVCSCGQSSFGASPRASAEVLHFQHAADPSAPLLRDRDTTKELLARIHPERKASS